MCSSIWLLLWWCMCNPGQGKEGPAGSHGQLQGGRALGRGVREGISLGLRRQGGPAIARSPFGKPRGPGSGLACCGPGGMASANPRAARFERQGRFGWRVITRAMLSRVSAN